MTSEAFVVIEDKRFLLSGAPERTLTEEGALGRHIWPSAFELAARILRGPSLEGVKVLELGCGVGLVGLSALSQGAEVVFNDVDPGLVERSLASAELNGLRSRAEGRCFDWSQPPEGLGVFDRVFGSDIFYESTQPGEVLRFLKRHLAPEGRSVITDPLRARASGVMGAARLAGFEVTHVEVAPGTAPTGGMQLFALNRRDR